MENSENETGACVLLLDFPPGSEIGIDFKSWKVGNRFKGIKGIPPGLHLIYSSVVDKCGQVGFRTGFFADFEVGGIVVKKWDRQDEWFVDGANTEEDLQRYRDNMTEVATYLGPYPQELYGKWVAHSDHISAALLARVVPNNRIDCVPDYVSPASNTEQRREAALRAASSPSTAAEPSAEKKSSNMKFSDIQLRAHPSGCSPSEVSRHMMDKSFALTNLLNSYADEEEGTSPTALLLGEFQLAFLAFLLCSDFEGFEQWKRMCGLLCRCEHALSEHPAFFESMVGVLYHQLSEIPHDFFTDIVTRENFLVDSLHCFFAGLDANDSVPSSLRQRSEGFKQHLLHRFHWDFTEENEEDMPIVVDC